MQQHQVRSAGPALVPGLLAASHPGPTAAVTVIAALLAVSADQPATTVALVAGAVLSGQLTVGWANDLLDAGRDRANERRDKPLAQGQVTPAEVAVALAVAGLACLLLSAALGWRGALAHLVFVGLAHSYNLGLKATAASWVPYAAAFGLLPSVATLAGDTPTWAAWWAGAAGAALGVGAHLLNALPDLADDERTGVRGLPHRLGARRCGSLAVALLLVASVLAALGPAGAPTLPAIGVLVLIAGLSVPVLQRRGRWPFRAAMAIALLDVALLVGGAS